MDKEKQEWLKQIGAEELNPPPIMWGREYKYRVPIDGMSVMYYSETYLDRTPLHELKNRFPRWSQR